MNIEMVIYALVGLALLYLIIKLLKWPINFYITINPITALIAGFLGIPGVIFLVIFQMFF